MFLASEVDGQLSLLSVKPPYAIQDGVGRCEIRPACLLHSDIK